jgi:hypothetical protein
MPMLTITADTADAINTLDRTRTDGGLGCTYDGADYHCRDVREDPAYADYWPLLANARIVAPSCTPRQARLALASIGLLTAVEEFVAAGDQSLQIEWAYASEIKRDWPPVLAFAEANNLDESAIDELFTIAAGL